MIFRVLGPLEVIINGQSETPTAHKVRWTLGLFLLRANQVVDRAAIIDELWGEHPPRSAVTTAQTYVYQLRKKFHRHFRNLGSGELIETRPPGYVLRVDPGEIDAFRFERLSEEGQALLAAGHAEQAARRLREALSLWRGPVLADLPGGPVLTPHLTHLTEARTRALRLRILADAQLGNHRALIPELRSAAQENPLDEWIHEQLMIALHEAGRRADALDTYRGLQRTLDEELGIQPSITLRELQRDVLVGNVRRHARLA
uniref:DacT1 n=1 Tax=Dactylosporangium sp. SC14051 TaxID=1239282 RepID=K4I7U4_9ACTN|nr:DacT1 [Dactylosporangium sp. SC14051]